MVETPRKKKLCKEKKRIKEEYDNSLGGNKETQDRP